tara:strand:- start:3259 stop:3654 length:396 start_codon:yes stop_codon:yes gene_type:complete
MGQYNFSKTSGSIESIGTSFDVNKKASITLSHSSSKYFLGRLGTLQFTLDSISSASTISFMLTSDSAGDEIIITETSGSIGQGLTTTTKGAVEIAIDALLYCKVETFYIFPKVDTGSCNISEIIITYESGI